LDKKLQPEDGILSNLQFTMVTLTLLNFF